MKSKALVPLIASVLMGLVAALLARQMIKGRGSAPERSPSVKIVAAKAELPPGHTLTAEDLTLVRIAASSPPPNSATDIGHLVGRVILTPMLAGQAVLESQLAPSGTAGGLQALVPEGMRAISIDTTESSGLLGLLTPGSRVDVVTTATSTSSNEPALSRIIAQDVTVLAVGQRLAVSSSADGQAPTSRMVTLLVTPHDAAALDLAQTMARLRLILRGNSDRGEIDDDPVLMTDLRGGAVAPTPTIQSAVTPAATQPVTAPTVPVVATTRPAVEPVTPEPSHRIVTLILGDQEQRFIFREPARQSASQVSDANDPNDSKDSGDQQDPFVNPQPTH